MHYYPKHCIPGPGTALLACTAAILTVILGAGTAIAGTAPGTKLATLKVPGATIDYGNTVAISGSTAVVGQPSESGFTVPGKAFVFTKTTTGWVKTATLEASDHAAEDNFAASVAVSGSTIVVGDPGPTNGFNCGGFDCGAVYIFTKTSTGWKQATEIKDPNPIPFNTSNDFFGASVATTGNTVYIGAPGYNETTATTTYGAVFAYTSTTTGWKQTAKFLQPASSSITSFGFSLAASGSTVVVGAASGQLSHDSAAYVFTDTASGWTKIRLKSSDYTTGDQFGRAVAISGSTIAVAAPDHASFTGRAYIFTKNSTGWKQAAELKRGTGAFGVHLGLSGTALTVSTILVANPVYFYAKTATGWAYLKTVDLPARQVRQGDGAPLSVSGSLALAGDPSGDAAYIYEA
jgi:hypothetical protein